jgi:menaquinone-dependent protoporphyrinogen oxidase
MRTLIAYSTKHGATRRYAEVLAKELPGPVTLVDLAKDPGVDVSPFEQVVVGGAVYAGQVRRELKEFCARNLEVLKQKRLGLFIACWFQEQAERQLEAAYPPELLGSAVAKEALGGEINLPELTFFERLMSKVVGVKESCSRYSEESAREFARALRGGAAE